jgi:glycerol-3-phosphate responsive antiterminator
VGIVGSTSSQVRHLKDRTNLLVVNRVFLVPRAAATRPNEHVVRVLSDTERRIVLPLNH